LENQFSLIIPIISGKTGFQCYWNNFAEIFLKRGTGLNFVTR